MSTTGHKLSSVVSVLKRPSVTEKATILASATKGRAVYSFEVTAGATKSTIKQAIKLKYKVTPTQVNIVNLPRTRVFRRGKRGVVPGKKKALVYLKAGETIDLA